MVFIMDFALAAVHLLDFWPSSPVLSDKSSFGEGGLLGPMGPKLRLLLIFQAVSSPYWAASTDTICCLLQSCFVFTPSFLFLSSIQSFSSHVISHIFKITKSGNQKQSQLAILLAESFYYIKYGLSIITSKILSKILSNVNKKKTGVSRKIVCFGILIHILS